MRKHLNELREFEHVNKTQKYLHRNQKHKLNELIRHTVKHVPYYSSYTNATDITEFPVLNKGDIRERLTDFMSDYFELNRLKEVVTSGSTGLPFKVYQDTNKATRNTADTIYFASKANIEIGDKLAYIKIWNKFNNKSCFLQYTQNIVPINVLNLSDNSIKKILNQLDQNKHVCFLGYVSALESIALYIQRAKTALKFKTKSIITMSEGITPNGKALIEKSFNSKVFSRYSNVENGIIAQQTFDSGELFLINSASYYVEILDIDKNIPVKDGVLGRIVVTDYYNRGTVMLRYDTGDLGIKKSIGMSNGTFEYLTKIEGRKMDAIFNTKGELLSSFIITNGMWNYSELVQYQFIQQSKNAYLFKLNVDSEFSREKELVNEFRQYLGEDASISIEYVDEIPLLSSGKRKKVMNLIDNK